MSASEISRSSSAGAAGHTKSLIGVPRSGGIITRQKSSRTTGLNVSQSRSNYRGNSDDNPTVSEMMSFDARIVGDEHDPTNGQLDIQVLSDLPAGSGGNLTDEKSHLRTSAKHNVKHNESDTQRPPSSFKARCHRQREKHERQRQQLQTSERRSKRRRRRRTEAENDLFTSFTLNRDPENSKYLPHDEVVYPKLFNRPREAWRSPLPHKTTQVSQMGLVPAGNVAKSSLYSAKDGHARSLALAAAAELDNMWVVGFVENARRHQKDLLLRELRDFVRLPGSTVLPGAHAALVAINEMKKPTSFNCSSSSSKRAAAVGMSRSSTSALSGSATSGRGTSGSTSGYQSDGDEDTRGGNDERSDNSESCSTAGDDRAGGTSALTPLERLRLRELEKRLSQASRGVRDENVRHSAGVKAYAIANRKLRKILRGNRPSITGPAIKSEGLEAIFKRNRAEIAAAVGIQRSYKTYYRRKRFSKMIQQLRGVVRIQALARGIITRRFVAEWYSRRSVMVLAWQTVIRRMLSNIRWRRQLALEQRSAAKIQAVARGKAGRDKARRRRVDLAALRIQCLWRGSVDRARIDRLWLGSLATRIQGLARIVVAKRVVGRTRRISNTAARSIQRCFRGTVARRTVVRLTWERSMARRLDFLRVLAAEEGWERENIEITRRRSRRMRTEEKLESALAREKAAHATVYELESNEQELKTQRLMLSPRALQQGWKEELDSNIGQHREWITKRKLEAVFDGSFPARKLEGEVKRRDRLLSARKHHAARLARWRDVEMKEIFDREARRRFDERHNQHRRKVADEKRKWAVNHVTLSGKPDKLKARRRTRPWEAEEDPIEGVLKEVYTGGSVDLFAYDRTPAETLKEFERIYERDPQRGNRERRRALPGRSQVGDGNRTRQEADAGVSKSGTLEQVVAQLQLRSHLNQVAQFENIIRPAEDVMATMGLEPLLAKDKKARRRDMSAATNVAPASPLSVTYDPPDEKYPPVEDYVPERFLQSPPSSPLNVSPVALEVGNIGLPLHKSEQEGGKRSGARVPPSPQALRSTFVREHHGWGESHRPSAIGFTDRHGAAAVTPTGRPPPVGTGGTPVPVEWGEEERVKARQRQRRLHMLAHEDRSATPGAEGRHPTRSTSRVPWDLLDELDAEKQKLRLSKVVWR